MATTNPNGTATTHNAVAHKYEPLDYYQLDDLLTFHMVFGKVPQQFFPASDRPELMVDLWMPEAATFEASQREVKALEALIEAELPKAVKGLVAP